MSEMKNNLSTNDAAILKKTFDKLSIDIKGDFDKRISDYSNSLLFKYYSSLYYFLPKSCLLEIKDKGHNGYYIRPQEYFFIEDKRTNRSLTYTTRSESLILPLKNITTIKQSDTLINVSLEFENNFEYDYITIWLDPRLCEEDPFFATYIFNQILASNSSVKIEFSDYSYTTKDITTESINLQLKPTEKLVLNIHSPSLMYGFNIRIKDLFKYKHNNLKKIDLSFNIKTDNFSEEKLSSLFRVNLVPIFNSFDDYSSATFTTLNLSDSKLKHHQTDNAQAIEVLSVYENNNPCSFDGFLFSGQNEYYLNRNTQSLNYSIVFPELDNKILETKIHTYTTWTQLTEVSDLIEINSNAITSINSSISPIFINKAIENYNSNSRDMFNMVDMIISRNMYSKTTFLAIAKLLKTDDDDISLLSSLLDKVELDSVINELILTTSDRYNEKYKYFLDFFIGIICKFINQNTFSFIKKIVLNNS
ncbi:type VI secretion system baseplate subunit TssF/IglH [Francisella sciaenopsi]|uniref:Type VI secretion system baseplate subunit TssF/IglH n=1 Tax=Francisella sciaenopsi TaxID=3055034 RepID=A0ABQ6PGC4_9GAMM